MHHRPAHWYCYFSDPNGVDDAMGAMPHWVWHLYYYRPNANIADSLWIYKFIYKFYTDNLNDYLWNSPSSPLNASLSITLILLPSNSSELSRLKCVNTFAGTVVIILCANIKESKFCRPVSKSEYIVCVQVINYRIGAADYSPSKSPSLIVRILFSCISSFFSVSNMESAFCGTLDSSLPPRFKRFSFL